jgi:chemotaxis protein MotB
MRRKKQEDEVQEGAAWLTSYADMVTLLFVFFVLMFAISSVDQEKFKLVFAGIQGALTDEMFMAIRFPPDANEGTEGNTIVDPDNPPPLPLQQDEGTMNEEEEDGDAEEEEQTRLQELYRKLEAWLIQNNLFDSMLLHEGEGRGDRLLMTLPGDIWFESGRADISPAMHEIGVSLAQLIRENQDTANPFRVVVAGHTDNVPQSSAQFPNNWWLSSGRANNFLEILKAESGLNARYFYSKAYGEEQPIGMPFGGNIDDYNQTPEQKQANRRVEILISLDRNPQG